MLRRFANLSSGSFLFMTGYFPNWKSSLPMKLRPDSIEPWITLNAVRKISLTFMSLLVTRYSLLVTEGFDGVEPGGAQRGSEAADDAGEGRDDHADDHEADRELDWERRNRGGDAANHPPAQHEAGRAAEQTDRHRLDQELQ